MPVPLFTVRILKILIIHEFLFHWKKRSSNLFLFNKSVFFRFGWKDKFYGEMAKFILLNKKLTFVSNICCAGFFIIGQYILTNFHNFLII